MLSFPLAGFGSTGKNMSTAAINVLDGGSWPKEGVNRCVPTPL